MTRQQREQEARRLLALRPQAEAALRGIAGVRGIGIGIRSRSGALTGELVFKVYVDAKRPAVELPPDQVVPPEVVGVPTDVMTIGRARYQCWEKGTRPMRGGLEIGQAEGSGGTITCIATTNSGKTAVISNEHVLRFNTAQDKTVFQPYFDSCLGFECNKIGSTTRGVIGNVMFAGDEHFVDCAIAECDDDIGTRPLLHRITNPAGPDNTTVELPPEVVGKVVVNNGKVVAIRDERDTLVDTTRIEGTAIAVHGELVWKIGSTTGFTVGVVSDFTGPLVNDFPIEDPEEPAHFPQLKNVIVIDPVAGYHDKNNVARFSAKGDSGSAIMNLANQVCGVLTGDITDDTPTPTPPPIRTFACQIYPVLEQLQATIRLSPQPVVPSGALVDDDDAPEPLGEPLHVLRARISTTRDGVRLLELVERHAREAYQLVLRRRAVTVAWHRHHGPQFTARLARELRDRSDVIPQEANGLELNALMRAMAKVLSQTGSEALREAISANETWVLGLLDGCASIPVLLERLSS